MLEIITCFLIALYAGGIPDTALNDIVTIHEVPQEVDTSRKMWMDYRTITDETSDQYAIQQECETDENGFRIYKDKFYVVAVGTGYASRCGEVLEVALESRPQIPILCIVGDIKQDAHTDPSNRHTDGNVIEFIVDIDQLHEDVLIYGDANYLEKLSGKIQEIKEYNIFEVKYEEGAKLGLVS